MSTPKKNVTHVIKDGPDGIPVRVPVENEAPTVEQSTATKPRRSFQDTEVSTPDAPLHNFRFEYEGYTIFGVELTQAQLNECKRLEASLNAVATDAQTATDPDDMQRLEGELKAAQRELWDYPVQHSITGWTFPRADGSELPCNEETKAHLPLSDKETLYLPLVQKSTFGGPVERFLVKR